MDVVCQFARVHLKPGESTTIAINVSKTSIVLPLNNETIGQMAYIGQYNLIVSRGHGEELSAPFTVDC